LVELSSSPFSAAATLISSSSAWRAVSDCCSAAACCCSWASSALSRTPPFLPRGFRPLKFLPRGPPSPKPLLLGTPPLFWEEDAALSCSRASFAWASCAWHVKKSGRLLMKNRSLPRLFLRRSSFEGSCLPGRPTRLTWASALASSARCLVCAWSSCTSATRFFIACISLLRCVSCCVSCCMGAHGAPPDSCARLLDSMASRDFSSSDIRGFSCTPECLEWERSHACGPCMHVHMHNKMHVLYETPQAPAGQLTACCVGGD
jgi:hypothetical protein